MKYRPHRRYLDESMEEVIDFPDRAALIAHLAKEYLERGYILEDCDVRVEHSGFDKRINWDSHVVTLRNKQLPSGRWYFGKDLGPEYFGAIGWTDGPAAPAIPNSNLTCPGQ